MSKTKEKEKSLRLPPAKREPRYFEVWQDEAGGELVSDVSLVSEVDMHPLTTGERMARFLKAPELMGGLFEDLDPLDEDMEALDDDGAPMTMHEDRFGVIRDLSSKKKKAAAEKAAAEKAEAEKARLDQFAKDFAALRDVADQPPAPAKPDKKEPV